MQTGPDAPLAPDYQTALAEPVRDSVLPAIMANLCGKIAARFRRLSVPEHIADDPVLTARWKLRGTLSSLPFPDQSGTGSAGWPGNQLTREDMRRLNLWGRLTGLPTNRLLHVAVGIMAESLRLHMIDLLAEQQETGVPFEELLSGTETESAVTTAANAGTTKPRRRRPHPSRGPSPGCADQREAAAVPATPLSEPAAPSSSDASSPPDASVLAAEPPSAQSSRRTDRTPPTAADSCDPDGETSFDETLRQLRETRDEMRVLWQAVDELRETMEHAMRNLPEPAELPRFPSAVQLDLAAEELVEQLQALPAEILATVREQLAVLCEQPPPARPDTELELPVWADDLSEDEPAQPVGTMTAGQSPTELVDGTEPEAVEAGTTNHGNGRHRNAPATSSSPYRAQKRLF